MHIEQPLARTAGEGGERSEAGEGVPAPSVRSVPPSDDLPATKMLIKEVIQYFVERLRRQILAEIAAQKTELPAAQGT